MKNLFAFIILLFFITSTLTQAQEITATLAGTGSSYGFSVIAGGNTLFRVIGDGNVGIGTITPSNRLDVRGRIAVDHHTMLSLANQTDFKGTMFFGGGSAGYNLSNAGGDPNGTVNTAVGYEALFEVTTGHSNTVMGYYAGRANTDGYNNTFVGWGSGQGNISGAGNCFYGNASGMWNTGDNNVYIGNHSGHGFDGGDNNVFLGESAGGWHTDGSGNVMIGRNSGFDNTTASTNVGCVFIGYHSGRFEKGDNKLIIENSESSTPLIGGDFSTDDVVINGNLEVTKTFKDENGEVGTAGQLLSSTVTGTDWIAATSGGDFSNGGEASGTDRTLGNTDNFDLSFKTNNTSRFKIQNDGGIRIDGNVGIFNGPSGDALNKSLQLYGHGTYSNPFIKVSGHNSAYIDLESRRTGTTNGKVWKIISGGGSVLDLDRFSIYNADDGYVFNIRDGGDVGIGTQTPTAKVDVNGSTGYDQLRMRTSYTPSSSSDTNGNIGDIAWDDSNIYIKTSTGWMKAALTTF